MSGPTKCVGIGRIFGHRFRLTLGSYHYSTNYCTRCGFNPRKSTKENPSATS